MHQCARGTGRDRPVITTRDLRATRRANGDRQSERTPHGHTRRKRRAGQSSAPAHAGADRGDRARVRRASRAGQGIARRSGRALHPLGDRDAAPARAPRPARADRLALAGPLDARRGHARAGEDPREHGDRPQRHARPVGLDERSGDQLTSLGLGHGLDGRGMAALAQLHPPHLHQHPRQGPRSRLRDHADRPPAALEPGIPVPALLQRPADAAVRVGGRGSRPRLDRDPGRRQEPQAGAQGAEGDRGQGSHPDPEGLHRVAAYQRFGGDRSRRRRLRPEGAQQRRPARPEGCRPRAWRASCAASAPSAAR